MQTILILGHGPVPPERRELLAEAGFLILETENAADAITLAERHRVDLILLSAGVPGQDGLRVGQHLRSSVRTGPIPVVQISADISSSQVNEALFEGADAVLVEPVDDAQLLKAITATLKRIASGW